MAFVLIEILFSIRVMCRAACFARSALIKRPFGAFSPIRSRATAGSALVRFVLVTVAFSLACSSSLASSLASSAKLFPYATFTEGRKFVILAPREVEVLHGGNPARLLIYKQAISACGLEGKNLASIEAEFTHFFRHGGPLERGLDSIFPDSFDEIKRRSVTIVVDNFGFKRNIFRSFHIAQVEVDGEETQLIALDCSSLARADWLPSLAHELTHALFARRNLPSWFDEALAQLVEREVDGRIPQLNAQAFTRANEIPPLMVDQAPLPSGSTYALAYLFGEYIKSRWGGWETLRAMARTDNRERLQGFDFLTTAARNAQKSLGERRTPDRAVIERTTAKGFLRFFAAALAIHSQTQSVYNIPGWRGWQGSLDEGSALKEGRLLPGQFALLRLPPSTTSPKLVLTKSEDQNKDRNQASRETSLPETDLPETYLIITWNNEYRIIPQATPGEGIVVDPKILQRAGPFARKIVLTINFSRQPLDFHWQ
jgi:hypothetical protein